MSKSSSSRRWIHIKRIPLFVFAFLISGSCLRAQNASFNDAPDRNSDGRMLHPISLADAFGVENIGALSYAIPKIEIDPAGKRAIFLRRLSLNDREDFSVNESHSGDLSMDGQLYVYDLKGANPPQRLLGAGRHTEGESLIGFSPGGTRALILWLENGKTKIGAFEFASHRLIEFAFTPALLLFFAESKNVVWLSEDEFLCSALPAGEQPGGVVPSARAIEHEFVERWERAWKGKEASVDILESHSGYPDLPARLGALLRINARTGAVSKIADGVFFDLNLSPNRRYLAAARQGGIFQPPPDSLPYKGGYREDYRRYSGVVLDLLDHSRVTEICAECRLLLSTSFTWAWDEAGSTLAFFAATRDRLWSEGDLYLFKTDKKRLSIVQHAGLALAEKHEVMTGTYGQIVLFGGGVAVVARSKLTTQLNPTARSDWYLLTPGAKPRNLSGQFTSVESTALTADKDSMFVLADGSIWRVSAKGAAKRITATLGSKLVAPAGLNSRRNDGSGWPTKVVTVMDDPSKLVISITDVKREQSLTLETPPGTDRILSISPSGATAILERTTQLVTSLSLVGSNGLAKDFWTINRPLSEVKRPRSIKITYQLADGTDAASTALLPPDWAPGKRAPVVLEIYPGHLADRPKQAIRPQSTELFTSMGYIVLDVYSGGLRFNDAEYALGNWSGLAIPALDALIKAGYADPQRAVGFGISAGGWSVLALATQTQRLRAIVANNSLADFYSNYGGGQGGWMAARAFPNDLFPGAATAADENPRGRFTFAGPPWQYPLRYIEASPIFKVADIRTPIMLVHSDLDGLPMWQFDEMFGSLFRLRKDAQYVRYWGEGHGNSSPANIRDWWSRMLAWFDRWCDIARDPQGNIVYERGSARSRSGASAWKPEDFLKLSWFFKTPTDAIERSAALPEFDLSGAE